MATNTWILLPVSWGLDFWFSQQRLQTVVAFGMWCHAVCPKFTDVSAASWELVSLLLARTGHLCAPHSLALLLSSSWLAAWFTLPPWRWVQCVLPKWILCQRLEDRFWNGLQKLSACFLAFLTMPCQMLYCTVLYCTSNETWNYYSEWTELTELKLFNNVVSIKKIGSCGNATGFWRRFIRISAGTPSILKFSWLFSVPSGK